MSEARDETELAESRAYTDRIELTWTDRPGGESVRQEKHNFLINLYFCEALPETPYRSP